MAGFRDARSERRAAAPRRPFTLFERAAILLSVGFLGLGFLLPGASEALLRLYFPALAFVFVAARVHEARLPQRSAHSAYSPFLHTRDLGAPLETPRAIGERARRLRALDDPARTTEPVPAPVRWLVREHFSQRLAERRGLHLADPSHHENIEALVSAPSWALLRPPDTDGLEPRTVGLDQLDTILDDLEEL